ncbi:hypothetical protein ACVDG8_013460 [Mesorhizobium sp. ORM8.1]
MIAWLPERQPGVRPSAFSNLTVDIKALGLENAPSIEREKRAGRPSGERPTQVKIGFNIFVKGETTSPDIS